MHNSISSSGNPYIRYAKRSVNFQVSALGLSCFRIAYTSVLMCSVADMFYFRHLIFDPIPYVVESENSYGPVLIAWLVTLALLWAGLFTKTACVVNYVLTLLTFSSFHNYAYHLDYIYTAVNLLLIFTPVSERLSLDALRRKLLHPVAALQGGEPPNTVSIFHYDALILIGIALVYFDSAFFKWMSPMWISGLGVWLPASMPHVARTDLTLLLDQKWLILLLGYATLILETVFIFLMWWRKARLFLLAVGMGLHLGIVYTFPIPWFGLAVAALYLLLVPQAWYEWLFARLRRTNPNLEIYYDPTDRPATYFLVTLKHFDIRDSIRCIPSTQVRAETGSRLAARRENALFHGPHVFSEVLVASEWLAPLGRILKWPPLRWVIEGWPRARKDKPLSLRADAAKVFPDLPSEEHANSDLAGEGVSPSARLCFTATAFLTLLILSCQSLIILDSPLARWWSKMIGAEEYRLGIVEWFDSYRDPARIALGTTAHPVFIDSHFRGYNHIIGLAYKDRAGELTWLPITDENGGPEWYNRGRRFVRWSWRANGPKINEEWLQEGIKSFSAFWCHENHINLIRSDFVIFAKRIEPPRLFTPEGGPFDGWEKGFYRRQKEQPWQMVGNAHWTADGKFEIQVGDIEKL